MPRPIHNIKKKVLSDAKYTTYEYTFDYEVSKNRLESHKRIVFDHGDGASVLMYHRQNKTVLLTRQFRLPTFLNKHKSGYLVEVCAGMLDGDTPEDCVRKEAIEETGYEVFNLEKAFAPYASPGVMTEIAHLFVGEYDHSKRPGKGGGLAEEHEHIEILEMDFNTAYQKILTGEIKDARTILLLQYLKIKNPF
ncbi:NUDIX domain-containing protein [Aquimarina sp. ERC-38]|uniref:NUDIX domain-containing protein n=1 Tax=Aquimarina sp. ERC-38 TaxID=2949996 RepID=UPI0022470846|nr:NUDIX domain-containing protein [Aquimarina sp. ERC-38]UZO82441.1 NUDIX domain-containing protein [Aquimarina sp. ERC-38]